MKKQQLSKLLSKYLEGKCTPNEELMLGEYLEFLNNKNAGRNENKFSNEQLAGEETYSKIARIINNMNMEKSRPLKIVTSGYLLKIAASFISILALSIIVLYLSGVFSTSSNQVVWKERKTISGEKSIINFNDGTKITLNGNSKLKYLDNGFYKNRRVYLEGEAYFEVAHDSSKPFVVYSNNISTTVLGTKFDINTSLNNKEIAISLVEGKVNVSENKQGFVNRLVTLQPKEQFLYNSITKTYNVSEFDTEEIVGWKDNLLKFKDETIENVFSRLERGYGVKFELAHGISENYLITTHFKNASLMVVAEAIKKFTGLGYDIIKENYQIKKIIFRKK